MNYISLAHATGGKLAMNEARCKLINSEILHIANEVNPALFGRFPRKQTFSVANLIVMAGVFLDIFLHKNRLLSTKHYDFELFELSRRCSRTLNSQWK